MLLILNCTLQAAALGGDIPATSPRPEARIPEVPIKLYQRYFIVVEGRLGSLDHQHLLLDTGTNPSMIDAKVSARLGLQSTARSLSLFNKNIASRSVVLSDLQFGPLQRQNLEVMVADFSGMETNWERALTASLGWTCSARPVSP